MSINPFALSAIQSQPEDTQQDNPFSLRSIEKAQGVDLREKLNEATTWNPDSAAEAARLAKRYPAPTDTVYRNLDSVKRRAAVDDAQAALTGAPDLAARMRENPDLARQAHDDVGVLSEISQAIRNIGGAALSGLQRGSEGVLGAVQAPFDLGAQAIDPLVGTILPANPLRATAQGLSAWRQRIKGMAEGNMPKGEGNLEQGFYSGISSLSTNLAALPLAMLNPAAGLTAMVAPVGGQGYGQARDQGVAPLLAAQFGMSQAAIEYATEKIPVQRLIGDVRAGTGIVKTLLKQMALEVPGEQVATVFQDLNEWALLPENADKTFADYLAARPDAAIQTLVATVVGTGGNVAVVKGIDAAMRRLEGQDKGIADGEALKEAMRIAGQSKLLERNPEAFREALDAMAGDAEVRFDARTLLEQSSPDALVKALPSLADQLAEAQASGGEVRVPVSEFIAGVVGTPLEQSLREHARLGENEMSQAEAKDAASKAEQFLQQEAERVIQQAQDQAAMRQSQEVVKQGVLDQLNTVGRFSPQVNEAYATFASAFYTTMAGRAGITPEEMAARYPLRILGQTPGASENASVSLQSLADKGDNKAVLAQALVNRLGLSPQELRNVLVGEPFSPQADGLVGTPAISPVFAEMRRAVLDDSKVLDAVVGSVPVDVVNNLFGSEAAAKMALHDQPMLKDGSAVNAQLPVAGALGDAADPVVLLMREAAVKAAELIDVSLRPGLESQEGGPAAVAGQGDGLGQGRSTPLATFNPSTLELALNSNANLSSFLHESGHFFLEVMSDLASQPNAPAGVVEDMNVLLKWFGITGDESVGGADSGVPLGQGGAQIDSEAFKRWFGDSKVVDDQGRPLVVYHGTEKSGFAVFDPTRSGQNTGRDFPGIYFTNHKLGAETYSGTKRDAEPSLEFDPEYDAKPGNYPVYLKMENPYFIDFEGQGWDAEVAGFFGMDEVVAYAIDAGHDGVVAENVSDEGRYGQGYGWGDKTYVVFDSTQIKSATGNDGTFDANDPSILSQGTQPTSPAQPVAPKRTPLETWQSMTLDQKRPYHERFAESIEQYLMEGKAPSIELQPVFHRFRSWLLRVYKSVKEFLAGRGVVGDGGETLGQRAVAAEVIDTGKISPITRNPIFELRDAGGQRIGLTHSYKTAAEAIEKFNAPKNDAAPAPTYSLPEPDLPKRSNWKQVKGQKFTALDEDDGYLYHVTAAPNSAGIRQDGLAPNAGAMFGGAYANYSSGKVFVTERSGVSFWVEKVEQMLFHNNDNPPAVVVMRIPKDKITVPLEPDDVGTRDANARAYYSTQTLAQGDQAPGANIQLSDEVRQVFDRMLASEEQIRQAEEVAGMLPDETATADAIDKLTARSLRDMKWLANARSKAIKALQKQAAALRKEVKAEVTAEVNAMPEFLAKDALDRLKVNPDFTVAAKAWRDSREEFVKQTTERLQSELLAANPDAKGIERGQLLAKNKREIANRVEGLALEWEKSNPRPKKSDNATPADLAVVADSFGFPDVDTMLKAIDAVGKKVDVIEGMTDQRMLERHGDLIDQRAIEEAANAAVHNDARAKVLATELKAQADLLGTRADTGQTNAAGKPITVNALQRAAQLFAENVVARTPLKSLKRAAWDHTAAERRAAKAWQEATAAGKTQEAVQAKQDQVLNNAAAKAALDAQQEVVKIRDFFARIVKGNDEKTVERGRDPDVVNAARAILTAYGVQSPASKNALAYLETVKTNDPAMYAAIEPAVSAALLNPRPLDTLTISELRALRDELDSLWHLSKRSRQMEVDGNLMDIEDAVAELQTRLQDVPPVIPGELSAMTPKEQAGRMLQFAVAITRRVEAWAEALDGKYGGPFTRLVFGPVKAAADRYRSDRIEYRRKFVALLDNVSPTMRRGLIEAPELGYVFGKGHNGVGMAELLHAVLHTGNASNKRKLLLGRGWATELADGTLDTTKWDAFLKRMTDTGVLTKAHYDFAQGVWDLLEGTKALAQKAHRDVFGRYFAEVTAEPFDTPFGSYRGGYVPAQADTRIVTDAALRDLANQENENMAFAFPTTNKGFTKARVEYNRPLVLDLRTIAQHLDKVLLFSHMEPAVRDVRKALMSKGVSQPLSRIQPAAYEGMLTPWMNRAAKQIVETPVLGDGKIGRIASAVRARAGMALMFGNVSNTLQQITGLSSALVKVSAGSMMNATATYIAGPKKMAERVATASPYMAERIQNEVSIINETMNEILLDPSVYERAQVWTQKHAYFLQSAFDNVISPIVWTGAYNDALKQGMTEPEAVKFADSTVRQTQGSTMPEDVSRIETGPAFVRLFSQFIGYFNMVANTNATALMNIAGEVGLKKGAGRALGVVFAGLLMPIWVAEFIAQAMRGGPDDEDKDGWWIDDWLAAVFGFGTIKGIAGAIPGAGQVGQLIVNRFNDQPADDRMSLSPAVSVIESAAGAPASVYKAIVDDASKQKAVRDVASLVTVATGLPASFVARSVGYAAGVADDRIEPTGPIDAARGAISGVASPESKQR